VKYAKGEDEGAIAEWSKLYESELEKADQDIKLLDQQIKKMDDDEREAKTAYEHERKLAFELELFERKAKFQEELEKTKQGENNQHSKPTFGAKLPKLPITKFNGKTDLWLPFWGSLNLKLTTQTYRF
jgi:hypothetical protein